MAALQRIVHQNQRCRNIEEPLQSGSTLIHDTTSRMKPGVGDFREIFLKYLAYYYLDIGLSTTHAVARTRFAKCVKFLLTVRLTIVFGKPT